MGPLFSIALLAILALAATTISFGVAKLFLPMKLAAISAMLFLVCSCVGGLIGLVGQSLWLPATLESTNAVLRYLGVSAAIAAVAGSIAVWLFVTSHRAQEMRG